MLAFLCILPFMGAAGGPDRAGSAAVQAQTAQKRSQAGYWGRGLALAAAGSAGPNIASGGLLLRFHLYSFPGCLSFAC